MKLNRLLKKIRACDLCADYLTKGVRPVLSAGSGARIAVIGQAPGRRVHESGVPWKDPSGDRLRLWLGVDDKTFYDPDVFAIIPMGFCFPGSGKSGDLPPRPECAPAWHEFLWELLPDLRLSLLIGRFAQEYYLEKRAATLTETVRAHRRYHKQSLFPLPHPSPRNGIWLRKNPWFETEVLPALRRRVKAARR